MKQSKEFERAVRISEDAWDWYPGCEYPDMFTSGEPPPELDEEFHDDWYASIEACKEARALLKGIVVRQPRFATKVRLDRISVGESSKKRGWVEYEGGCLMRSFGTDGPVALAIGMDYATDGPMIDSGGPRWAGGLDIESRHIPLSQWEEPSVLFATFPGENPIGYFLGHFRSFAELKRESVPLMKRWLSVYRTESTADLNRKLNRWRAALSR
jgi:hypothetical protein